MKTEYHVVIVEDDPLEQKHLTDLLNKERPLYVIDGVASSVAAAKELIQRHDPDLVLMDVQLPPHTCFDLLKEFERITFSVIFITSHDEFALKAFRLSAIDYLLKPLSHDEFATALEKFERQQRAVEMDSRLSNMLANFQVVQSDKTRISLPTLTGFLFVPVSEIVRCEADDSYTLFFLKTGKKIVVSKSLKETEQMLTGFRFFRVHHSHLINLDHISAYERGDGGTVVMVDGSRVDVSRRRKDDFLNQLGSL